MKNSKSKSLKNKIKNNIILLDGAFGTYIQSLGLRDEDFGDKVGCMEQLSLTRPDLIEKVHSDYFEAGSDAVETNTFGANALKLREYGLEGEVYDINLSSTKLARKAADRMSTQSVPKFVVGTMGPTGKLPSSSDPVLGGVTYNELKTIFHDQALGIIDGGADALLVETGQDLLEMKAGLNGSKLALKDRRKDLLLMVQCTLANNGRMLLGSDISAVSTLLSYIGADVIGLNCSTGPVEMEHALEILSATTNKYISCVPNAGLPVEEDGNAVYLLGPDEMAEILSRFIKKYKLNVIGGCCGTTPEHIRALRDIIKSTKKSTSFANKQFYSSFYRAYDLETVDRPIIVGERINAQGSRKMKELLVNSDYDEIIELGKLQEKQGASMLDVCAVLSERSTETQDAVIISRRLSESLEVPLMIDSTDLEVIKNVLGVYPGTIFINSVNLEDGGRKAEKIFLLAKEHGSFVVNLVIDEKGMADTVERKLEIAKRLYNMGVGKYGLEPHRMIFDMLTFTLGTGEEEYKLSAVNTFKAIKEIKRLFPGVLTSLGVSNVSFGLHVGARKVLNMVFLHYASIAGLDLALINPVTYIKYSDLPENERLLAENVIFNKTDTALNDFVEYFEEKKTSSKEISDKPLRVVKKTAEEKIRECILNRDKTGIIPLVEEALKGNTPENIINNILMPIMKEVGDKLDSGDMVLPFVLQSAEVMRNALEHIEDKLPHDNLKSKGKVLLATVFGDVHDIGKNLVKMILVNNGFSVIDLGKQVPVETIVAEAKKNKVDAVGLSALLVSTARHMKTCVQSMNEAGLSYPVLIGGAPVSERYSKEISLLEDHSVYKGGVFYAKDAFTGLNIIKVLTDKNQKVRAIAECVKEAKERDAEVAESVTKKTAGIPQSSHIQVTGCPAPPFFGVRTLSKIPIDKVFPLINENAVFHMAWGAKLKDPDKKKQIIEKEYKPLLEELKSESLRKGWLDLKAVYGYFKCQIDNTTMTIFDKEEHKAETIVFDRIGTSARSLTDYFPAGKNAMGLAAFQAVTVGPKVSSAIESLNETAEETRAFLLHGLSVHLAEALAEYVHGYIRSELKLGKTQGKRYSPGYPLWPNLSDQQKIFNILEIEKRIGLHLTCEYQIVPEQSTTAMVVCSEGAEY